MHWMLRGVLYMLEQHNRRCCYVVVAHCDFSLRVDRRHSPNSVRLTVLVALFFLFYVVTMLALLQPQFAQTQMGNIFPRIVLSSPVDVP
jgi:hypothetical protein